MLYPRTSLACALLLAWTAAHADSETDAIRAEIQQMKAAYEARIAALEARLAQAEQNDDSAHETPREGAMAGGASGFNPEASLILQGRYAKRDDLAERTITGFMPAVAHNHGSERGFTVDHTELVLSANVDPHFRGQAIFAMLDSSVEVEEAWFQTIGLGHGLTVKGGRFASGLGYLNEQHPHVWDFADAPLMYQALFGERFSHDGVQMKWLAPTDLFLELGLEAGNGNAFPGGNADSNGIGAWTAFAHIGGDVGSDHSWRAGLSHLHTEAKARAGHWEDLNGGEVETAFTGRSQGWIADFVWKWAPAGNANVRNFKLQAEYFQRRESGSLLCQDVTGAPATLCTGGARDRYRADQSGWYAQAVYQFMPRWRVGVRHERLGSGGVDFGSTNNTLLDRPVHAPEKHSVMLDFSPSEFSRLRMQWARDASMQDIDEDQWTLQYILNLGSHGAHRF